MSFIKLVEPEDASVQVRNLYDYCLKEYGVLFNNWKLVAHVPHLLEAYARFLKAALNPVYIEKRIVELAILKTSLINECTY